MRKPDKKLIALGVILLLIIALLAFFVSYLIAGDKRPPAPSPEITTNYTTTTAPAPTTTAVSAVVIPQSAADPLIATEYNILDDNNIRPLPEPITIQINADYWYLTLVNNQYRMPADYAVNTAPAIPGSDVELDSRVAAAYTAMYNAAATEGIYLTPYSGFRSYNRQTINYDNKTQMYIDQGYNETQARAKAAMVIMPPGCSEHNLGLAMDIIATNDNFYTTKEYSWLDTHAAEYGFILRYPKDKQAVTQVEYEPWHWRYVGVEFAQAIKASGLCLEEYLTAINMLPTPMVSVGAVG
ncbi:MAG: M15 family metallopeptidase [Clostridia bacterium]|nr:M15 family metallopeptidase [Clostridia bacterium]